MAPADQRRPGRHRRRRTWASGQTGHVDTHSWERFGLAALISVFGMAPQLAVNDQADENGVDAINAIGGDLESAPGSALDAYLRIGPTINVAKCDRLTIFVDRDLVFSNGEAPVAGCAAICRNQ